MKNYFKKEYSVQEKAEDNSLFYKEKYDEADETFEKRFEKAGGNKRIQVLEGIISDVMKKMYRDQDTDSKLISLVLGNVNLRLAQCQSEAFQKSKEYYEKALVHLERHIDYTSIDEMDLLIMLNKGKYFRNTAEVGRKSDYERAFSIFKDVTKSIEQVEISAEKKFHLILDSKINMGRVRRYSYNFSYAMEIFLALILSLEKYIDEEIKAELHEIAVLDQLLSSSEPDKDIEQYRYLIRMSDVSEYTLEYLLQSLIHIGIIFRKNKEYEKAIEIFQLIKKIDQNGPDGNIDAMNNLGVCYRKLGEIKKIETAEGRNYLSKAKQISETLANKGNKFATINLYKCKLDEAEIEGENLINKLKGDEGLDNSMHLKFILGRAYAKIKNYDAAIINFESIHKEKKHIARGSLGFKVYYNLAQCKIYKNEFHKALEILLEIRESLEKNHDYIDILTEIDYGWCLMKEGNYNKALQIYRNLLNNSEKGLDKERQAQVNNNIVDCYIHLGQYDKAEQHVDKIFDIEKNDKWTQYLKGIILLNTASAKGEQAYKDSYEIFDALIKEKFAVEGIKSAWLISAIFLYNQNKNEDIANNIAKNVNYSLGSISMKCFMPLADFILEKLNEKKSDHYSTLYRDFCHIKLTDRGENQAFQRLMNSMDFHFFKKEDRAFLLANIVRIYKYVLDIKESCLVTYDENGVVELPYHYTKLSTLSNLLIGQTDKKPRLRLWNTIYMNDAYEGRVFDELLRQSNSLKGSNIIENYVSSLTTLNVYLDSNVYITSFSTAQNSFQMWSIYGENEKGVAIKFEEDFFDIKDYCKDLVLDNGTNDEYALYKVQYLDINHEECDKELKEKLDRIGEHLEKVETRLIQLEPQEDVKEYHSFKNAETEVRAFIMDRLNEVRFLFKTRSYEYENELRLIRCSHQPSVDDINFAPPRLYIDVEKDIKNLDIKIGSRLESQKIKDLFVWLRNTKKVRNIKLSNLNETVSIPQQS